MYSSEIRLNGIFQVLQRPAALPCKLEPSLRLCLSPTGPSRVRCFLVPSRSTMRPGDPFLSDNDYHQLWNSLQQQENHVCTRACEFKQVFGNMYYCTTSGQAHVCDQNCSQRIFYDNHHDICRLSRRTFLRTEAPRSDMSRKRNGEEAAPQLVKRMQSADWQHQQVLRQEALQLQQQQQAAVAATPQQ